MPKQLTNDELDSELAYVMRMHRGQEMAIRRWNLCMKIFGLDAAYERSDGNPYDRQLRKSIERLRREGYLICNLGNGDGYFLAETQEEYQKFRAVYVSHAAPVMETARMMDKAAGQKWPNPLQPGLL